jgi:hypothetical protein
LGSCKRLKEKEKIVLSNPQGGFLWQPGPHS